MDGGSEFQAGFEQACQQRDILLFTLRFTLPPRSPNPESTEGMTMQQRNGR